MGEQSENRARPAEAGAFTRIAEAIGTRNLYIIIAAMPVVFLIIVIAIVSALGQPGSKGEKSAAGEGSVLSQPAETVSTLEQPPAASTSEALAVVPTSAAAADPAPLVLPRGAHVGAMALDGDRLALRVEGENGGEIVIYDLTRGAVVQRIRVTPQQSAPGGEGL